MWSFHLFSKQITHAVTNDSPKICKLESLLLQIEIPPPEVLNSPWMIQYEILFPFFGLLNIFFFFFQKHNNGDIKKIETE